MSIFAGVTRDQLASLPLFEGLDPDALDAIASRAVFIGPTRG